MFEELHEFSNAEAFARHLHNACNFNYGTPIRAFLEKIACDMDEVCAVAKGRISEFVEIHVPEGADGQVHRVAQRFGLIAAAGEMAIAAGVISTWELGDAVAAAARCFDDWLTERGGVEPAEIRDGIAQVRAFLSKHGEDRFGDAWNEEKSGIPVRDLAGYRKQTVDGSEYYITCDAWKDDVCKGRNAKTIAAEMLRRGFLRGDGDGRANRPVTVPGGIGKRRLYCVRAGFLEAIDS
jgi:uncharacterized protein (DUF927 family)